MFESVPGRRPPRLPSAALLVAALAVLLLAAGCGSPAPAACPDETYPAVELAVVDESDEPLIGASLRYRIDDGQWLPWPENLGRQTV
ncbi:MAG: hypothetical protein PVH65_17575, partial [Chloroflexota bacterium]